MKIKQYLLIGLSIFFIGVESGYAGQLLTPFQALQTSAARGMTPFKIKGEQYLAVPQLATDDLSIPPKMNSGNADADVLVFKWRNDQFQLYQRIPGHGNENAAFFSVGNRSFLAVASINSGPKAPYNFHTYSTIYEWDGMRFYPVQQFYGFASKKWTAFNINDNDFLALANGVVPNQVDANKSLDTTSSLYKWDGKQFVPFQTFPTKWAYGFYSFSVGKHHFLGVADHAQATIIYRWNGKRFIEWQRLNDDGGGRALTHFQINGQDYLAYANIKNESQILKWNGKQFESFQTLPGLGGRSFTYFDLNGKHYLFRVNFILGARDNPQTVLTSPLYIWRNNHFEVEQEVTTYGGVDADTFSVGQQLYLGVANSIDKSLRYKVDSMIYKVGELK